MKDAIREQIIEALKKRFPGNNPASWKRLSEKKLWEYYIEYKV